MITATDLVEDWIGMRSTLQRQIKALEGGEHHTGVKDLDSTTSTTIARLKRFIGELNELLKDHARDSRT